MRHGHRYAFPAVALALGLADAAVSQGGGGSGQRRGRSEIVAQRLGNYFVNVTLPRSGDEHTGVDRLAAAALVSEAAGQSHLSVLYLYDPQGDERKHRLFETTLFNNDSISIALRCFRCGKVDLSTDIESMAEFGKKAPLFVAFDAAGKPAGEVSMSGYKVASAPLITLLGRAAKGHTKPSLEAFTKKYRTLLNDLAVLEGRKGTLRYQHQRAAESDDQKKLKELEKDEQNLADEEQEVLDQEAKMLAEAKVPPRSKDAEQVGGRRRDR